MDPAKREWIGRTAEWLHERGVPVTGGTTDWLEHYYDQRPEEWRQQEHDAREMRAIGLKVLNQPFRAQLAEAEDLEARFKEGKAVTDRVSRAHIQTEIALWKQYLELTEADESGTVI
jgi:hypothetical protein